MLIISIPILVYFLPITKLINQAFVFLCLISSGLLIAPIYHRIMQVNISAHIPQYLSEEDTRKLSQERAVFDVTSHINELENLSRFHEPCGVCLFRSSSFDDLFFILFVTYGKFAISSGTLVTPLSFQGTL